MKPVTCDMKLIFATHNQGKLKEMRALLAGLPYEVLSAQQAGVADEVEEDGQTLEQNALKKAHSVAKQTGQWAVADDTGLFIEALNGRPGVRSARWAGESRDEQTMIDFTLRQLIGIPAKQRGAFFESVIALVSPAGKELILRGKVTGKILETPRGTIRPHLPYDCLFLPLGSELTFAEMSDEKKNSMSHRGNAFRQLKEYLNTHELESA